MDFSPDYILSCYTKEIQDIEYLKEMIFYSGLWASIDNGDSSFHTAKDLILDTSPERLHSVITEFFSTWYTHKIERKDMREIIVELKEKGYGIYLCSNAASLFHQYKDTYEVFDYFDNITISADVNISKPESGIYEIVLNANSLDASECLFIDDVAENIRGAMKCGIAGYHYNGNAKMFYDYLSNIKVL